MKIAILSDSHDNLENVKKALNEVKYQGVEYIFHLGDFVSPFTFKAIFENYRGHGFAVFGNNDGDRTQLTKIANSLNIEVADTINVINFFGRKILLMHGFGSPELTKLIANSLILSNNFDFVFFGHTHEKSLQRIDNKLALNPGELGGVITGIPTFAIFDLSTFDIQFIKL